MNYNKKFVIGVRFYIFEKSTFKKEKFLFGKESELVFKAEFNNYFWNIFGKKINGKIFYQIDQNDTNCQMFKIYLKQIKSIIVFFNGILNRR